MQDRAYKISAEAQRNLDELERRYVAIQRLFMFKVFAVMGLIILIVGLTYLWGLS